MSTKRKGPSAIPHRGLPPKCDTQLSITDSHIESFDYFLSKGLPKAVEDLTPVDVEIPDIGYFKFWFDSVQIGSPCGTSYDEKLYPTEVNYFLIQSYFSRLFVGNFTKIIKKSKI